jgi:integrase
MQGIISANLIKTLKPTPEPYEIRDTRLPGFLVRVQPSGHMSYYIEFARGRRMLIGPVSAMKPDKARKEAEIRKADHIRGDDPIEAKKKARAHTLRSFIEEKYTPWAEANHRHAKETLRKIASFFGELGSRKLPEVSAWSVEKYRTQRIKSGTSVSTTNRELDALKASLSKAVEWHLLDKSPISSVKRSRVDDSARIRYLSGDEQKRLTDALNARDARWRAEQAERNRWRSERGYTLLPEYGSFVDHLQPFVTMALNTGCRRGELFNLKWNDLDMGRRMLTVVGKTAKSLRTRHIPLNDDVFEVVRRWYDQTGGHDLVFPSPVEGNRLTNIKTSWKHLMRDADIKAFRLHDCRHDFASQLVMKGVDLNTVRELLGHSDIRMTLRYAHLAPEKLAAAVAKLVAK